MSGRSKIQNARLTVAFALGEQGTEDYMTTHPDLAFDNTFGISRRQFKRQFFWRWHNAEANNCLDQCEELIYRSLFMHPAYRQALVLYLVSHSHEWFLGLLTKNSWMVNMAAIGDRDALEFAAFDVLPSDKDVEEYSKSEEFREIKKEIIDFLAIYSE